MLAEVLSARLADVVRELAEKECSVRDLNEKLYRTFDRVAEQVGTYRYNALGLSA